MSLRIGVLALLQESNTFLSAATTWQHFAQEFVGTGEAVRAFFRDAPHEVGGMFAAIDAAGATAVPLFAARALPFGTIDAPTTRRLLTELERSLHNAGELDGIVAAAHGATVAQPFPDFDGHWLGIVRAHLGPTRPLIATLDCHANLSPAMVAACDAFVAYRTNPHLDQRARGHDAARLLVRTLRGEVRPTMQAAFPPFAINIERQALAEEPGVTLMRHADAMLRDPRVLSNSLLLGFPYADVPEMGTSFVVVTDNDPALAATLAHDWARLGWERRAEFQGTLLSPCECLEIAQRENVPGPVLLLDMGDNVGGGSPGDGTILAHELQNLAAGPAFMCLYDPQAQAAARSAGVGARLTLTMGGKTDRLHGPPLIAEIAVVSLADGRFEEPQPRHGGYAHFDQGPTAIVETSSGLTVMLTSQRMPPFSIQQLSTCGLDPAAFRFIVTKGVNAPLAAYAPVCPTKFRVNTPGCTTADMRSLAYQHRRRPMFPWEDVATWPT